MTASASPSGQAVHLRSAGGRSFLARGAVSAKSGFGPPDDDNGADPIPAGTGNVAGSTTYDGTGTGSDPFCDDETGVGPAMLIITLWGTTEDPGEVELRHRRG
jgi:hypothetical protein